MRRFNYQALGRLKIGQMNKTETAYSNHLETLRRSGEVLWFKFEGVKLRLADNTFFTADFLVLNKEQIVEMHEVKGSKFIFQDDAKVKIKVAAELYPFQFFVIFKKKTDWVREAV